MCYKENFVQSALEHRSLEEFEKAYYETIMKKSHETLHRLSIKNILTLRVHHINVNFRRNMELVWLSSKERGVYTMKKLLILFLFIGVFLCFAEGSSSEVSLTPAPTPDTPAPTPDTPLQTYAIIVQCPYCNTTNTVYSVGTYSCSNCGHYFEVVPAALAAPPPVVVAPPPSEIVTPLPPVYYDPYYPYYPGWYGPGLNLRFRFRHGGFERGHFERGHEHRHGGGVIAPVPVPAGNGGHGGRHGHRR